MIAVCAEADLIVADQFRDGNVPAHQEPLDCRRMAFVGLPLGVKERNFRGDSACYERQLLGWLSSQERTAEPGGRIGSAISAHMSPELSAAAQRSLSADGSDRVHCVVVSNLDWDGGKLLDWHLPKRKPARSSTCMTS